MGTDQLIEEVLKMLDTNPWDDLGNWPADADIFNGMKLSETKMKNTVDHREPRTLGYDDRLQEYSVFDANIGKHSADRAERKSDIEDLGEGIIMYFKFLKYFMKVFLICTIISGPAITMFSYGMQYDTVIDFYTKVTGLTTLGNLGSYMDMSCSSTNLPAVANSATYIGFKCKGGKKMTDLQHFGLAYQNQTCKGIGFKKSVTTVDRCTIGTMNNA